MNPCSVANGKVCSLAVGVPTEPKHLRSSIWRPSAIEARPSKVTSFLQQSHLGCSHFGCIAAFLAILLVLTNYYERINNKPKHTYFRRKENNMTTLYSETIKPWFGPRLLLRQYGISIDEFANKKTVIRFGYGWSGPSKSNNFFSHTTLLSDIDPSSVVTGVRDESWQDNLFQFRGWGVKYGKGGTRTYNATLAGPYCEFVEVTEDGKQTKYRIVTKNPELVARLLRGEEVGSSDRLSIRTSTGRERYSICTWESDLYNCW